MRQPGFYCSSQLAIKEMKSPSRLIGHGYGATLSEPCVLKARVMTVELVERARNDVASDGLKAA